MYRKQEIIIKSYREGKSQRAISRELQISRKTVKKYIKDYEDKLQTATDKPCVTAGYLSTAPAYKNRTTSKRKLTQEVQNEIDKYLECNGDKKRQGLRKQMLKKVDIFEQLQLQGYEIGYTTVCNYISSKEKTSPAKEAFIRQVYAPGSICEFDWGEIKLKIKDKQERFQLAVFTSAYSNYRHAVIYPRQDTLAFMEAHVSFFNATKGVYHQMVYDNMRVAVSKFIGPNEKEPTHALLQLRGHYQFTHRFCNAYRGNEKGHVERSVEYIRRKAFGLKDRFEELSDAEDYLRSVLDRLNNTTQKQNGRTALQLFEEEKTALGALPETSLTCSEQIQLRVDKYATISYRTNRYSVPDNLVGKFLEVHLLSHEIHVYSENKRVATHLRNYSKHQWIVSIEHYLETFKQKPGALPGSLVLASNIYLKQLYLDYFQHETRSFIELLDYCRKYRISGEKLEKSVFRLISSGSGGITVEKLKALLGNTESYHTIEEDSSITQISKTQLQEIAALMN
jgi:transposase